MDDRTAEALSTLKARLLTAKRAKAETLGVPPYVLQQAADTIERLTKERDAALAEVELLKMVADTIKRLQTEVERLRSKLSVIGGGRPRCKLCSVILEDGRKEFCSTCCAQ